MSQTETLLLFVLGFCVALFVVLLFGRGIWALIGTWSGWRETRKVPAAIRELQAERDSLKAEKAMMAQKLESALNDTKMRMAEQMAEISRNRNRLLDLGQTLKEREATIVHVQSQADDRAAQLASLQTQIEENVKAINLAYAKMAQREDEHTKMQVVLKEAQATLLMRDEKIRNLVDEAKALRELVSVRSSETAQAGERMALPPVLVSAVPPNNFEQRFANSNNGNPFLAADHMEPLPMDIMEREMPVDSDSVDRSVSNVLSLAERVRSLQTGMKKA